MDQCYENVQMESTRDKVYTACLPLSKIQAGDVAKTIDRKNVNIYISFKF